MKKMEAFLELIKSDRRGDGAVPYEAHARLYRNGTLVIAEVYHDEAIGVIDDVYRTYQLTKEEMDKVYGILLSTMNIELDMNCKKVWYNLYVSDDTDMCFSHRTGSLEGTRLAELAEMFEM